MVVKWRWRCIKFPVPTICQYCTQGSEEHGNTNWNVPAEVYSDHWSARTNGSHWEPMIFGCQRKKDRGQEHSSFRLFRPLISNMTSQVTSEVIWRLLWPQSPQNGCLRHHAGLFMLLTSNHTPHNTFEATEVWRPSCPQRPPKWLLNATCTFMSG